MPEASGDAGFALLRHLSQTLELGQRLVAPPGDEDAPSITGARSAAACAATSPLAAGDYLVADPLAYHERILDVVYSVTPLVALVLDRETALVVNAPSKLRLRHHDWMRALDVPSGAHNVFADNHVHYGGEGSLRSLCARRHGFFCLCRGLRVPLAAR